MVKLESVHDLLQKDVSRQEFLRYIGIGLLGLIGVTSMLQNLHLSSGQQTPKQARTSGYGYSAYGR